MTTAAVGRRGQRSRFRYQWHGQLHQSWGREQLCFWQIGFRPTYDRQVAVDAILSVLQRIGVRSYAVYELTGKDDLMLRIWLPQTVDFDEAQKALRYEVKGVAICVPYRVSNTLRHWIRANDEGDGMESGLSPDTIRNGPNSAEIELINQALLTTEPLPEMFERYLTDGSILDSRPHPGIKFFITIPQPPTMNETSQQDGLRRRLMTILRNATGLFELSLYEGQGFCQYLIVGRTSFNRFYSLNEQLLRPLNSVGISDYFGVRTFTYVTASEDFLAFADQLTIPGQSPSSRITAARQAPAAAELLRDESDDLEIKAAAFVDVGRWLETGEERPSQASPEVSDAWLKAVVGMLNNRGGSVVLGALESHRYPIERFPRLGVFPRLGGYTVVGSEMDWSDKGWDRFERRILDSLDSRIEPSASRFVSVSRLGVEPSSSLTLLSVTPPPTNQWFYLKPLLTFYVRLGNRTIGLNGSAMDNYKSSQGQAYDFRSRK